MLQIVITPKADHDSDLFFLHIAQDSQKSALEFLERLEETYNILSEFPLIAPSFPTSTPALSEVRHFPVKQFSKHLIFYTVSNEAITIIRLLHKTQDIEKILT